MKIIKNKFNINIIATIGPATHSELMIRELANAGVNIFRINLSHAKATEILERFEWIRRAEKNLNKRLLVMGDLPGPKIRISDMAAHTILEHGQRFIISKEVKKGDKYGCGVNFPIVLDTIQKGAEIYLDDGKIKLQVQEKSENEIETIVIVGGLLKPRKGFSGEGISFNNGKISDQDKKGIEQMVKYEADMLAISFVEDYEDVIAIKNLIPKNKSMQIIAKLETINGVKNAKSILKESHGLMIARGDMGLALPLATIPRIQKNLIKLCSENKKLSITATHMLESMINNPIPTRAEVTDVYNAVLDGTGAVMLSAETAEGKFPVETVEMMKGIVNEALNNM
jgi:pyruvate kinase